MASTSRQLFMGLLRSGAIGFGGGAALIPVIQRELVDRRELLDESAYTAHTVISNITPGAQSVKLGAMAGASIGRPRDALSGAIAVALPGVLGTLALLACFAAIGPSVVKYVEFASVGISMFVIGLLGSYIAKVVSTAPRWVPWAITLVAFALTGGPKLVQALNSLFGLHIGWKPPAINAIELVLGAVLLIWISTFVWRDAVVPRTEEEKEFADEATAKAASGIIWTSVTFFGGIVVLSLVLGLVVMGLDGLKFIGLVGVSTLTSFGGGAAYIGVADGFFVASGLISSTLFYGQLVPVANAMPGPVLIKLAAAMGFAYGLLSGGWLVALGMFVAALVVSVASCSAVAVAIMDFYAKHSRSLFLLRLDRFILPVICGLLLTTSLSMINSMVEIGGIAEVSAATVSWVGVAGVGLLWWLRARFNLPDLVLLVGGGAASLIWLLLA